MYTLLTRINYREESLSSHNINHLNINMFIICHLLQSLIGANNNIGALAVLSLCKLKNLSTY